MSDHKNLKKFYAFVPWYASGRVIVEAKDAGEAKDKIENGDWYDEPTLCHHCAHALELDGGMASDELDNDIEVHEWDGSDE